MTIGLVEGLDDDALDLLGIGWGFGLMRSPVATLKNTLGCHDAGTVGSVLALTRMDTNEAWQRSLRPCRTRHRRPSLRRRSQKSSSRAAMRDRPGIRNVPPAITAYNGTSHIQADDLDFLISAERTDLAESAETPVLTVFFAARGAPWY